MNKNELEIMTGDAKKSALCTIERLFGVKEKMIVKVKPQNSMRGSGRKSWMGCYRSNTIFSAHGIPVIWIADNIHEQAIEFDVEDRLSDIVADTILHEYAHAVQNLVEYRSTELQQKLMDIYAEHDSDHEDFAEDFALLCSGRFPAVFDEEVIEDFMIAFFEEFKEFYRA